MTLTGLILAAGSGKRMHSDIPKVLHPIADTPMLEWVIRALKKIPCDHICLVLSPHSSPFSELLSRYPDLAACIQKEANGTAGAVAASQNFFEGNLDVSYGHGSLLKGPKRVSKYVLICAGDTPALDVNILRDFIEHCRLESARLGVLGMNIPKPHGYGRMLLSKEGSLLRIVEEKDADDSTKKMRLCNSGIFYAEVEYLFHLLRKIDNKNAQNEYYLTDCVKIAASEGEKIAVSITDRWETLQGVNDKEQLASLDVWFRDHSIRK